MSKKTIVAKKKPKSHKSKAATKRLHRISAGVSSLRLKIDEYLLRRPHRSFRRTRRRDYSRSLNIPGYWAFTLYVYKILWSEKRLFLGLIAAYAVAGVAFVGLSSQASYDQLTKLLDDTGSGLFEGGWGTVNQAGLLLLSGLTGSIAPELKDIQQVYAVLFLLLTWLTTVWLLRMVVAGRHPRLRDGLYNAGSPIVATGIVLFILVLQLLPAVIGAIVLSGALATDLFQSGLLAMVISIAVLLLVILSLYWTVSTVLALIIITLPGMYPYNAIRSAGDIVVGRRLRILLRIIWMNAGNVVSWIAVILPVIIIDRLIKNVLPALQGAPIVPLAIALVSSAIVVWSAAYMYLLYRKVVEDDASPA